MENVDNAPEHTNDGARPSLPQPQNENGNESRNRNLDIIKAYIQRQRVLLERIRQDVDRLQASKPALDANPSGVLSRILQSDVNDNSGAKSKDRDAIVAGVGKLSELVSEVHGSGEQTITKDIDWNLFRGSDLIPLHSLRARSSFPSISPSTTGPTAPPLTPSTPSLISARSSLSSFVSLDCTFEKASKGAESIHQIHVRKERAKTVDPALTIASQFLASLPPDSDDECTKQARAREAKEAKGKEARNVKSQNVKTYGHVRKSAHRRKSEASAAAAASRPRGQGGRFKKKEAVVDETLAPRDGASRPSNSASFPTAPVSEMSLSTQFVISPDADSHWIEGGRPQRIRKPSIRFASAAPSTSSSRSAHSGSSTSTGRNGNSLTGCQSSSSPLAPSNPPRGRLTIRIPARPATKGTICDPSDQRDRQVSASTSTTTTSSTSSTTESTSLTPSVGVGNGSGYNIGGKQYTPASWSTAAEAGYQQTSNPVTAAVSALQSHFFGVKWEDEEAVEKEAMDVDNWDPLDERKVGDNSPPQDYVMNLDEDEHGGDSDDSFVPEVLPPPPDSLASSSSTSRTDLQGPPTNGNAPEKAESNRIASRRGNPLSKTFNVAWSDEEQRLLDMLLERYPDGTKNRWANISRAMGGTRTPRQVASRVQKYFAKMKKWGIDVS